jgi:hypothetical protein
MWLPVDNQVLSPMSARTQPQANLKYKGIQMRREGSGESTNTLHQLPFTQRYRIPLIQIDLFAIHDFVGTPHLELPSPLSLFVPIEKEK